MSKLRMKDKIKTDDGSLVLYDPFYDVLSRLY